MKAAGRPTSAPGGRITIDDEGLLLLRVDEAARLLAIGTTLAYELIARGDLPSIRLGRSVRVPRAALEAWISARTTVAPPVPEPRR